MYLYRVLLVFLIYPASPSLSSFTKPICYSVKKSLIFRSLEKLSVFRESLSITR